MTTARAEASPSSRTEPDDDRTLGLADRLRRRTAALHREAERTGIVAAIIHGRATRDGYALLLRNLLPAYEAMEAALERHRESPGVRLLARPELFRAGAIVADLEALLGPDWPARAPALPSGDRYAARVAAAGAGDGAGLIGHAYVRYLGDLNGGRILAPLVAALGAPRPLTFHAFAAIDDLTAYRADYRSAIDRAGTEIVDTARPIDEAEVAFRLNIEIAQAVADTAA